MGQVYQRTNSSPQKETHRMDNISPLRVFLSWNSFLTFAVGKKKRLYRKSCYRIRFCMHRGFQPVKAFSNNESLSCILSVFFVILYTTVFKSLSTLLNYICSIYVLIDIFDKPAFDSLKPRKALLLRRFPFFGFLSSYWLEVS